MPLKLYKIETLILPFRIILQQEGKLITQNFSHWICHVF